MTCRPAFPEPPVKTIRLPVDAAMFSDSWWWRMLGVGESERRLKCGDWT